MAAVPAGSGPLGAPEPRLGPPEPPRAELEPPLAELEPPRAALEPPLAGRRQELAWLGQALARVRGGAPAALLIGGEAGIGKSRLVSQFAAAAAPAARVLTGNCPELGPVGLPFAPFTDMLAQVTRDPGGLPAGTELARLLPGVAPGSPLGDAKGARARLFVQVLALAERLARPRPLVLVVEDAHWASESTREMISFLVQGAPDGVLIIVTYRSDELHRCHPLGTLLSGLGRLGWVLRTELARLGRDESDRLAEFVLGRQPPLRQADAIWCRAAGHPLFTAQLARCDCDPGAAPNDLMLAAAGRLPDATQDVLRMTSAGGQRTGSTLLAAVTRMSPGALAAALLPAVDGGVLQAGRRCYAFRDGLAGEALHHDLLPGEHTRAHRRFAAALAADPSLAPPGRAAFEQAEHWRHAHDPARALASAWTAAGQAARMLAGAEERALLERVLELWPSVPQARQLTGTSHAQIMRRAGLTERGGRTTRARSC